MPLADREIIIIIIIVNSHRYWALPLFVLGIRTDVNADIRSSVVARVWRDLGLSWKFIKLLGPDSTYTDIVRPPVYVQAKAE